MLKKVKRFFVFLILSILTSFFGLKFIHWLKNKKKLRQIKKEWGKEVKRAKQKKQEYLKKIKESDDRIKRIKNKYSKIIPASEVKNEKIH